jgi:hypothetical protein
MAQSGSAPALGAGSFWFKSRYPDHFIKEHIMACKDDKGKMKGKGGGKKRGKK